MRAKRSGLLCKPLKNKEIIARFCTYWDQAQQHEWPQQPWYTGTGLHHDPAVEDMPATAQVCGPSRLLERYHDTLSYRVPVDGSLFLGMENWTPIRCKITSFRATTSALAASGIGWHHDESPYEALRLIIPLSTAPAYLFQLDNQPPINLRPGMIYAFDQSQYHRVFCQNHCEEPRLHLILGYSTWFDWNGTEWVPGAEFNRTHPLDLFERIDF